MFDLLNILSMNCPHIIKIVGFLFLMLGMARLSLHAEDEEIHTIHILTEDSIGNSVIFGQFILVEGQDTTLVAPMRIRLRGANSRTYPKKSYRLEFISEWDDNLTQDVSLLGMRSDDDWNLNAMYNEPLKFQTAAAYEVWHHIHSENSHLTRPAYNGINTEFVFVYLNGNFEGIYLLTERVDRKQLQLNEETGELYKTFDHTDATLYRQANMYNNNSIIWDGIEWKHPEDIINWENLYDYIHFVTTSSTQTFLSQYPYYIDVDNFLDYFIFLNLLGLIDNEGKNIYIAREDEHSPYFLVPWDLDGSFGFSWDGTFTVSTKNILSNGLFKRLMNDCYADGFGEKLKIRWENLRTTFIDTSYIYPIYDKYYHRLNSNNVYELEKNRWPKYHFSEYWLQDSKNWLSQRIATLDDFFDTLCDDFTTDVNESWAQLPLRMYPNPARDHIQVQIQQYTSEPITIKVFQSNGQKIWEEDLIHSSQLHTRHWPRGFYVIQVIQGNEMWVEKWILQ